MNKIKKNADFDILGYPKYKSFARLSDSEIQKFEALTMWSLGTISLQKQIMF